MDFTFLASSISFSTPTGLRPASEVGDCESKTTALLSPPPSPPCALGSGVTARINSAATAFMNPSASYAAAIFACFLVLLVPCPRTSNPLNVTTVQVAEKAVSIVPSGFWLGPPILLPNLEDAPLSKLLVCKFSGAVRGMPFELPNGSAPTSVRPVTLGIGARSRRFECVSERNPS